jgi:hypothetical protein
MRSMRPRLLAKARRRHPEAPAEDAREVRRLAVAHQPRHVAHLDRRLLGQELRRDRHAPRQQLLAEARLAELRVCALQLTRRARHGPRHHLQRERPAVVTLNYDPREQIQPASARQRL